jgi:hypothetical protein
MTADDFRRIVLGLQGAAERAHMGHPDFRANDRIFASLHHDMRHAMVKLTPDEQRAFVSAHPEAFAPENGAWGRQGCTRVRLDAADVDTVGEAVTLAWRQTDRPRARASARGAAKRRA